MIPKNLILTAPDDADYNMKFNTVQNLTYTIINKSDHVVKDITLAANTVRRKYLDSEEFVSTDERYATVQLPPEQILPHSEATFQVKVELPEMSKYAEKAAAKAGGRKKMVSFKINVIATGVEYVPA